MNDDCLKLTIYFGERDRADGGFLADALTEIYTRHGLQTSLVMRGVEGFGVKQHLRTDRLLTLSEDLPLVSVAVDDTHPHPGGPRGTRRSCGCEGLVTLERARMLTGRIEPVDLPPDHTKLTVYVGRQERSAGQAHLPSGGRSSPRKRNRRRHRPARRRWHRPRCTAAREILRAQR